jgi:hypothetical protein
VTCPQPHYPPERYPVPVPLPVAVPYPVYPAPLVFVDNRPTSGLAVASLVLGILGVTLCCCGGTVPAALAVIFGHAAYPGTRVEQRGRSMATAGLVMGYLLVVPSLVFTLWMLVYGDLGALSGDAGTSSPTY